MKETKELEDIRKAIRNWMKKHKGNVQFIGSFMAFEGNDFKIVDDLIIGFGEKKIIQMDLKDLGEMAKKEKEFINW